jgi:hypothetical protein
MNYVPCADSSFQKRRYYCAYDYDCFRIYKDSARFVEVYDGRDGTTCSEYVSSCPC